MGMESHKPTAKEIKDAESLMSDKEEEMSRDRFEAAIDEGMALVQRGLVTNIYRDFPGTSSHDEELYSRILSDEMLVGNVKKEIEKIRGVGQGEGSAGVAEIKERIRTLEEELKNTERGLTEKKARLRRDIGTNLGGGTLLNKESVYEEVLFGDEKVLCRRTDMLQAYAKRFEKSDSFRKIGTVTARQATKRELISTSQDGMQNYAEIGDWIIQNPGDKDPYVFGDKNDLIEIRQEKFAKKYESIDNEPGKFRPKGIIKAVRVTENLVFDTPWGEQMAVKSGGWVADGGYAIAEDSFARTYEKIKKAVPEKKTRPPWYRVWR